MEPASPLLLAAGKHRLLGEIAEIFGWTDHTMIETAERLDSSAADKMRRSITVPAAVAYWSYAIKIVKISPQSWAGSLILPQRKGPK